jgi:hypothetical protein
MSEHIQSVDVVLSLGEDATPEEVNDATTQLIRELDGSSAESVEKVQSGEVQAGSKSADPITLGAVALTLGAAAAPDIVKIIGSWLGRRQSSNVSLKVKLGDDEIEFTAAASTSPEELEALTDRFATLLKKHSTSGEQPDE